VPALEAPTYTFYYSTTSVRVESLEAIKIWRENPEHKQVQRLERKLFYSWNEIQVVKVDRQYEWSLGE